MVVTAECWLIYSLFNVRNSLGGAVKKLLSTVFVVTFGWFGAVSPTIAEVSNLSTEIEISDVGAVPDGISNRSLRKMARAKNPASNKPASGLASVCKSVVALRGALLKNAWPGHINQSDARAAGFAFVCGADCPSSFPVSAYYSDGSLAFKLGYYGRWEGNGKPRAYCSAGGTAYCSASAVTRNARANKRDGKVYLDFGRGKCRSAVAGQRTGSTGA